MTTLDPLPPLPGVPAPCPLVGAEILSDLCWHDGPLCTLFRDANGLLLASWAGDDHEAHRWLVARMPRHVLDAMGDGAVTFAGAFTHPEVNEWWLSDRDGETVIRCARIGREHVTSDVLPGDVPHPRTWWHRQPALDEVAP